MVEFAVEAELTIKQRARPGRCQSGLPGLALCLIIEDRDLLSLCRRRGSSDGPVRVVIPPHFSVTDIEGA